MRKPKAQPKSQPEPKPAEQAEPGAEKESEILIDELDLTDRATDLIKQLQTERDDAIESRLRALADFQNFQRRSLESERRAAQSGVTRMVRSILPVLDHFDLALNQKPDQLTVEQLLGAVNIVRDEFNKALQTNGVERIEPAKGDLFDPNCHEAVMQQPEEGALPNTIVSVFQTGYRMGDAIIRPAKVAVAPPDDQQE